MKGFATVDANYMGSRYIRLLYVPLLCFAAGALQADTIYTFSFDESCINYILGQVKCTAVPTYDLPLSQVPFDALQVSFNGTVNVERYANAADTFTVAVGSLGVLARESVISPAKCDGCQDNIPVSFNTTVQSLEPAVHFEGTGTTPITFGIGIYDPLSYSLVRWSTTGMQVTVDYDAQTVPEPRYGWLIALAILGCVCIKTLRSRA